MLSTFSFCWSQPQRHETIHPQRAHILRTWPSSVVYDFLLTILKFCLTNLCICILLVKSNGSMNMCQGLGPSVHAQTYLPPPVHHLGISFYLYAPSPLLKITAALHLHWVLEKHTRGSGLGTCTSSHELRVSTPTSWVPWSHREHLSSK